MLISYKRFRRIADTIGSLEFSEAPRFVQSSQLIRAASMVLECPERFTRLLRSSQGFSEMTEAR